MSADCNLLDYLEVAKVGPAPTVTPRVEEGGGKMKTRMTRGGEDRWRTEGRLER